MECRIPEALEIEHQDVRARLARAAPPGTRAAAVLSELWPLLESHLERERCFALRPLSVLPLLVSGRVTPEMAEILELTERLKTELPRLLADHARLRAAMARLRQVAGEEGLEGCVEVADRLVLHAQMEEDVLYPAALVVGEYLHLRLKR